MAKRLILATLLVIASAAGTFGNNPAMAQGAAQNEGAPDAPQGADDPVYNPPPRGAPGGRVGGASRGAIRPQVPLPTIELLAPADHAGQTTSATPTVYYYVSRAVPWPMQLTISAPLQPAPVLEVTIHSPTAPGIYPLRLGDYRTRLEPGIVYTWSVSVIIDPKAWSRNIVASAPILRAPPNPSSESAGPATGPRQTAILAHAGLWYDALASAFNNRGSNGHAGLDRLMEQVGLTDAARFDRAANP